MADDQHHGAPYDQRLANLATAVDHCVKLGGVVLPSRPKAGFHIRPDAAPQPSSAGQGISGAPTGADRERGTPGRA